MRQPVAEAESDGTYFVAQPFHCAVGTKPAPRRERSRRCRHPIRCTTLSRGGPHPNTSMLSGASYSTICGGHGWNLSSRSRGPRRSDSSTLWFPDLALNKAMAKYLLDLGRITRETLDQLATRNDPVGERFGSTSSEPRPHTDKEMKCQEPSPH